MRGHMLCTPISLLLSLLCVTSVGLSQEATPPPVLAKNSDRAIRLALGRPGSPAPEFALESTNGETVRLSDFRGQTVLIHFWATWCAPCKITMPWLVDFQNKYAARGLHVLAVSLDDDATKVEIGEFADSLRVNFPVLIGNEKVAEAYGGIPAMPVSFLVSRDGRIVETVVGVKSKTELETSLRKALNPPASGDSDPAVALPTQK